MRQRSRPLDALAAVLLVFALAACGNGNTAPATSVQSASACPGGATAAASTATAVPFPATNPIPAKVTGETSKITVQGAPLPALSSSGADPGTCMTAPVVTGTAFSGKRLTIGTRGRPYLVLFVAHWCPHCRREVPLLSPWLRGGGVPKNIDVFTVATGTRPSDPNYPPSAWLRAENWPTEVLADSSDGTAASAYGLTSYPFFAMVDANGKLVARFAGEVTTGALAQALRTVG
ncbi:MAG: hypothetical protein JWN46_2101 [Acidimicrobiales bacterium]|nr:hypothetical protein [Acidimicrobiales bacterium]